MSGLKTTVRITVTSPLRGVFDEACDVTARPRDVEEREARSALQRLVWHFEAWLKKDEPRLDAMDEMAAEIAACAMAFARERDERLPSALLLHDCVEAGGICVGACIVRRYVAPGFADGSLLCGYVDATGTMLDGMSADECCQALDPSAPEITSPAAASPHARARRRRAGGSASTRRTPAWRARRPKASPERCARSFATTLLRSPVVQKRRRGRARRNETGSESHDQAEMA